jgi:hypothetical protein
VYAGVNRPASVSIPGDPTAHGEERILITGSETRPLA